MLGGVPDGQPAGGGGYIRIQADTTDSDVELLVEAVAEDRWAGGDGVVNDDP